MTRTSFLEISAAFLTPKLGSIDTAWYERYRRFVDLPLSRVAYVERGAGPAALFIHGFPLNSYQWRGALERLYTSRRCVAPDLMGMGFTETPANQAVTPQTQVEMLAQLLDRLRIDSVDLVANDSGGAVAQLFVAAYPKRVKSLLLTNCDVDVNSPPPQFIPFADLCWQGRFVEEVLAPQLRRKALARKPDGLGGLAYTFPEKLADETIDYYFRPVSRSDVKRAKIEEYGASMAVNPLIAIRGPLSKWAGPARMVWGMKDELFPIEWAEWLHRTLPGSTGIRRVEGANLFFPEEMPELIAEEAKLLWAKS